jgi:hypothetical protein
MFCSFVPSIWSRCDVVRSLRLFAFRDHSRPSTAVFATRTAMSSAALLPTKIRKVSRTKATKVEFDSRGRILYMRSSRPAQIVNRSAALRLPGTSQLCHGGAARKSQMRGHSMRESKFSHTTSSDRLHVLDLLSCRPQTCGSDQDSSLSTGHLGYLYRACHQRPAARVSTPMVVRRVPEPHIRLYSRRLSCYEHPSPPTIACAIRRHLPTAPS